MCVNIVNRDKTKYHATLNFQDRISLIIIRSHTLIIITLLTDINTTSALTNITYSLKEPKQSILAKLENLIPLLNIRMMLLKNIR